MPKLFENLWVKLAALILAILLWFHVATNKTYQDKITLPVTQVDISDKLVLTEPPPDSITVMVSATGKKLLRTDWKRSGLRLMVNRNTPGRFRMEITPDKLTLAQTEKVDLVEVLSPREWDIECDKKLEKKVTVRSKVVIHPDEGFAVRGIDSILPSTVTISGPASLINALSSVETSQETLEGVRNDLKLSAPIKNPGIYGLTVSPDSVEVNVKIVPIKSRLFSRLPIKLVNASHEGSIRIFPTEIELRIGGEPESIDTIASKRIFVMADMLDAKPNDYIPIKIVLPNAFSLLYKSADSVKIIRE
jgi:YbbR domain-containing protein